ncbi:nitroreductase family deazaflavin-dependent oxidoreductase [Rhodococcus tukisamuensis]|uniref:nitroreductase family deazaflavin-dependent oxidoreductase n=1 Tax=Rhodococcus tukisamuensis TaxID=168276 RepID=UPI000933C7AA|nr:nitroreductase family deazaflavin-dependent oxidoreductase [Rhodococcus tukisamuensis]
MPLRYIDPTRRHGRLYKLSERFGRTRAGQAFARHVVVRSDPWLDRVTGGRLTWQLGLIPSATLETTGARSGLPRAVQIAYFHDGRDVVVVASNFGGTRNPQWSRNLIAHPECEFGGEGFVATEVTAPEEYERLYALAVQVYAGWGDYRAKTTKIGRRIPVFRLEPRQSARRAG